MCSNNYLIHNRVWNTCANGFGRGCPSSIREGLQEILEESRKDELFNPMRLDPEDDEKLEEICQILGLLADQVAAMEDRICEIARKYGKK